MNPDNFAELALRRMKCSHINVRVSNDAVVSLSSKPITESRKRKRNKRDLSIWIPPPFTPSLHCAWWINYKQDPSSVKILLHNLHDNIHFQLAIIEEQSPFSSSSLTYGWTYDVFLNFRDEDTRFDFTINLYKALHQKGIHTFIDNNGLRRGEGMTPSLLKAIQESTIAITIFSKNYASSTFCLDELVHILECRKKKGQLVLPIFYDVEPSDVRHQRGNYKEAFTQHEQGFNNDQKKTQKWKQALRDAADIAGFDFKPGYLSTSPLFCFANFNPSF
ncbi:TMV resistance protein N-like [Neltuma alba]|uniref:TMV resistance protein N-like n=1 Tax=Neltuma alba TaxID=207710 RepID=UPI0010A4E35E|nr:TMV resistance protein N-like [Prosopis alba]